MCCTKVRQKKRIHLIDHIHVIDWNWTGLVQYLLVLCHFCIFECCWYSRCLPLGVHHWWVAATCKTQNSQIFYIIFSLCLCRRWNGGPQEARDDRYCSELLLCYWWGNCRGARVALPWLGTFAVSNIRPWSHFHRILLVSVCSLREYFDSILTCALCVILVVCRMVPESVRWLMSKNKMLRAGKIIRKAAEINGKELSSEMMQQFEMITATEDLIKSKNDVPESKVEEDNYQTWQTFKQFISSRILVCRILILIVIWWVLRISSLPLRSTFSLSLCAFASF